MNLCKTVRLHFANGETRETLINREVTNEEIEKMGVGEYFNLGNVKDDMQLCVKVEIFE